MKGVLFRLMAIVLLSLLVISPVFAKEGVFVKSIIFDNRYSANTLYTYVKIENDGTRWLDNLKITVSIPELDVYTYSDNFDLGKKDEAVKVLYLDIPEYAHGEYYARISVENDKVRRVIYRPVLIR